MQGSGVLGPRGDLVARKIARRGAPRSWWLRNTLRWGFLKGWIAAHLIVPFANWWGVMTAIARLEVVLIRANGERIYYGVVSYRVITSAGVNYIAADIAGGASDSNLFKYHGLGTGTNAEAAGDTALQTECTTTLNPDSTRATGSQSSSTNTYTTVGTNTFDGAAAVTEHGILTQAATGGGTLLDRSVFSAINVASGDSIQTTYVLTLSAGG